MESPESLLILYDFVVSEKPESEVSTAEFMREVGLKCISLNGVPRAIECLTAFHNGLPRHVIKKLCTIPSRQLTVHNFASVQQRGRNLWDSINNPLGKQVFDRFATTHPDLPVHILSSHYSHLLSDPPASDRAGLATLGGFMTSLVIIASLRVLRGTRVYVSTHMLGLKKHVDNGKYKLDQSADDHAAILWLSSDEGNLWILTCVDLIAQEFRGNASTVEQQSKL